MPFQITVHALFVNYVPAQNDDALLKITDVNGQFYFLEPYSEANDEAYYKFPANLIPMRMLNEMYETATQAGRPLFGVQEARDIVQESFIVLPTKVFIQFTPLVLSSARASWTSAPIVSVEEVTHSEAVEMWLNDRGSSLG